MAGAAGKVAFALSTGLSLAACAERQAESPASQVVASDSAGPPVGLAGTEWRLVEIQSMDDAQGTRRPEDPSKYTMRLGTDGTVSLTLNCNRASGTWTSKPVGDGTSGTFEFGPLAATLAICPSPSYDEQISGQAQYIRSFLLSDGRLYLSLMADGGIWAWEPADGVPFQATSDPTLEDAIRKAQPDYTRAAVETGAPVGRGRYVYGRVDLNGDGRREVLVYLLGPFFCGTGGCTAMLFTETPDGYELVSTFSTSRPPFLIAARMSNGWSDIIYRQSGGGVPAAFVRFSWDGKRYLETERLPGDPEPAGRRQLAGELSFDRAIPLEPGS